MRQTTRTLLVACCVLASALSWCGAARASWGGGACTLEQHCYSVTRWVMNDPPESVKGGVAFITTNQMDVPEWANGSFVDNEIWVIFQSSGGWIETGQTSGNGDDCCTLHAFVAHALNYDLKGYEEYIYTGFADSPTSKFYIEDRGANGDWCTYWAEDNVLVYCLDGEYPAYADELEAGIEAASNSRPVNEGSQEVAGVFRNGTWHPWQGSQTVAYGETDPEMCITPNYRSNSPGNAIWWIC